MSENERQDSQLDPEKVGDADWLRNDSVALFSWHNICAVVQDRSSKKDLNLLENVTGSVKAGEMMALMGSSGSGKTTLLNVLSRRPTKNTRTSGVTLVNERKVSDTQFRDITSYVEQEDALIGSLTVKETVGFAAKLSPRVSGTRDLQLQREDLLIERFGLLEQKSTLVGTPLRKGLSGGQKRRLSVASQVITGPKILFLDEPTSGLDSAASYDILSFLKRVARQYKIVIIASIHQPSTSSFELFDKLLLLSRGRSCYYGDVSNVKSYFDRSGFPVPLYTNPAEFLLDITNVDFATDYQAALERLDKIHDAWNKQEVTEHQPGTPELLDKWEYSSTLQQRQLLDITSVLLHRMFIKSYRDVVVYGIRLAMYIGLAIMMGTVWLRLPTDQSSIQPFINALFFGSAFMSFMAVAYVPAYLEDLATYRKDRANGLYGPLPFLLANAIIGIPYLFLISLLFSIIAYWLINFRPTGTAFITWVMWLFLDLIAAESLVVLVSSLLPIFVVALAVVAFANGLWMSVGGFLVPPGILNVFWKYVFHYIDYQAYVFQGMMVNEFGSRDYNCAVDASGACQCMYPSELEPQCKIAGTAVLNQFGYASSDLAKLVGIMLGISLGYRVLGYAALYWRR